MKLIHKLKRWHARISQPGTGGLIQPGDWYCVYPTGESTYYMSYGDAASYAAMFGGKIVWRYD